MLNQKELAQILGLSARQVQNLESSGILEGAVGEDGRKRYPTSQSVQRYVSFKVQKARADSTQEARRKIDLRSSEIALETAEMELAERQGQMIHIDDVEALVERPLRLVADALKSLPSRWAPDLVGCASIQDAMARLRPAVAELLQELHHAADDLDGPQLVPGEAAANPNGRS